MYRTIDTAIWNDPKFRALPAPGKLLFIYLITNPHAHVSGIYYLPDVTVLHESGVKSEALNTLWDTLSRSELVFRDEKLEVVWVKNMLKRQGMHGKLIAAAANHLASLHNSPLIERFTSAYPAVKRAMKSKGIDRVSRSRLQEQEKEQEQEQEDTHAGQAGGESEAVGVDEIYAAYPKHVEPKPSKDSIRVAISAIRKRGTPTPAAWLLGRVKLYADARRQIAATSPGADRFIPACHRWMRKQRYDEDPQVWATEVVGHPGGSNGAAAHQETPEQYAQRLMARTGS